jgi:FdrA protein
VTAAVRVFTDAYVDSVVQLRAMRTMRQVAGVDWASAAMGTPANLATLREQGVDPAQVAGVGSNDFVVVVRAATADTAQEALAAGEQTVFPARAAPEQQATTEPRSLRDAVRNLPGATVAVISVPGAYASLAAYQALGLGLHVLLFSDNVPLEKEIGLKDYARGKGLLVMGPGAGTAVLGGVGLGFANVVRPGNVGVVAAAGT